METNGLNLFKIARPLWGQIADRALIFNGETEYRLVYQALHPFAKFANVPPQYLELDGKLEIQVISPRCFEAAALGTAILFREL